ncbi:MAG: Asp23/Gls24 family envelope stress response protein [Anaerolineae bacterium]|nr:Asp23/Gls24 family envelope stress response protein [Anaerolineae bacterium]
MERPDAKPLGKTTIAPEVLLTIVRLTVLSVPGVARLCASRRGGVGRFLAVGRLGEGVHIEVHDDAVRVDVHVVVHPNGNMIQLARTIQREVARAIHDMVGMTVEAVNVHIEDVLFPEPGR